MQNAHIWLFNHTLASELGISMNDAFEMPKNARPFAQAYGGYQFGHFSVLGDGRAAVLGEHITPCGQRFDVQIKGAGKTPFSRGGDGKAAIAPMLREYIISEFMHAVGVPTTRSLYVAATGETVMREKPLAGAVLARTAKSHIRIGTLNLAHIVGGQDKVKQIADYAISRHFPEILDADNPYLEFLRTVMRLQAQTVAKWMGLGFVHGVMNTDNALISGETVDYGPCAFLDAYDPNAVFSSIDRGGRYKYQNQPIVAGWNLIRFAESLEGLVAQKDAGAEIENFMVHYEEAWILEMRNKLGLKNERAGDAELAHELLATMHKQKLDFTNTFRDFDIIGLDEWRVKWLHRLAVDNQTPDDAKEIMDKHNPAIIPRNHIVEEALQIAETGDLSPVLSLIEALKAPYEPNDEYSKQAQDGYVCTTFCGT